MGDIADAMVEGLFCQMCGGYIDGEEPGYPRYCSAECGYLHGVSDTPQRTKEQLDAHSRKVQKAKAERKREKRRAKRKRQRARKAAALAAAKEGKLI